MTRNKINNNLLLLEKSIIFHLTLFQYWYNYGYDDDQLDWKLLPQRKVQSGTKVPVEKYLIIQIIIA
jgi:hypothetical protein